MEPEDFNDISADDAFTVGDDKVDLTHVEELAIQIEDINSIEDDEERLEAAIAWAAELNGAA